MRFDFWDRDQAFSADTLIHGGYFDIGKALGGKDTWREPTVTMVAFGWPDLRFSRQLHEMRRFLLPIRFLYISYFDGEPT